MTTKGVVDDLRNQLEFSFFQLSFFYSKGTSMRCPIDGCEAGRFHSRVKYMRHWNERHLPTCIKYTCLTCYISYRRTYDMKVHICRVHNIKDPVQIELKTVQCKKTVMNNRGFIDPGFWVFKGRTTPSTTNTKSSATVSTGVVQSAVVTVSASSWIVSGIHRRSLVPSWSWRSRSSPSKTSLKY